MPGELKSGAYGFKYKGENIGVTPPTRQSQPQVLVPAPRPEGLAKPLSKTVNMTSPMYFDKNSFLEVLRSHGIVIDQNKKTMTIQSSETRRDVTYDLHDEEIKKTNSCKISIKWERKRVLYR